jgi:hypothetical protein
MLYRLYTMARNAFVDLFVQLHLVINMQFLKSY